MADKRYRVTIDFAHGIRHVLEMDRTWVETFKAWARDPDADVLVFAQGNKIYYFERGYLCAMVVEEVQDREVV